MKVTVGFIDGTVKEGEIRLIDFAVFERTYGVVWDEQTSETMRPEWNYFLAWRVLTRTGQETRSFDDFLNDIDEYSTEEVPLA